MVMAELRKTFDYVVVDTSSHLADFNLEVIESAQHILVVTALTIPAIKDAKLALKVLESLTVDTASVLLVVDRSDSHSDFNKDSIEQNLRHNVGAQIPYDPRVVGDPSTGASRSSPPIPRPTSAAPFASSPERSCQAAPASPAGVGAGGKADDKRKRRIFGPLSRGTAPNSATSSRSLGHARASAGADTRLRRFLGGLGGPQRLSASARLLVPGSEPEPAAAALLAGVRPLCLGLHP